MLWYIVVGVTVAALIVSVAALVVLLRIPVHPYDYD